MPQTQNDSLPAFEESLAQLETLVKQLEQGDLPLEEALKAFERGVTLTRQCQQSLRAAEQRVEQVLSGADGQLSWQPFQGDDSQ
ncbi:MAG: exodeoxyribonuclease VII small subunit [Oleiphilaceae bacterium]|nr:exodeoxyribonuclease VII small subunit [Oleiphilaceae bacterium]